MPQDQVYLILPSLLPGDSGTEMLLLRQGPEHPWCLPAGPVEHDPAASSRLGVRGQAMSWAEHLLGAQPGELRLCGVGWGSFGTHFCFEARITALPLRGAWLVRGLGLEAAWMPVGEALAALSPWESGVLRQAMTGIETGSMMEWDVSVPEAADAFDSGG